MLADAKHDFSGVQVVIIRIRVLLSLDIDNAFIATYYSKFYRYMFYFYIDCQHGVAGESKNM